MFIPVCDDSLDCNETIPASFDSPAYQRLVERAIKNAKQDLKKERDMYAKACVQNTNIPAVALEIEQKNYLLRRLDDIEATHKKALRKHFLDEDMPKTVKELKDRIAKGLFVIKAEEDHEFESWENPQNQISWRLTPADRKGYDAAKLVLADRKQEAIDVIWGLDYNKSLKALEAFESHKIH